MAKEIIEAEVKSNIGEVAKETEQLAEATKDAQGGFKKMGGAIKGMGTALKAAGIGLVVALFAKLMDVFRQNQSVVDFFNVAMESLSIAFNDLFKFLSNNIGAVTGYFKSIFEDPKQSIIDFGTSIKENLIERFESLMDTFGHLGKALKHLFDGEYQDAWQSVKDAGKESVDIITGVDGSVDKITETVTKATKVIKDYAKSTIDTATTMVELRKQSELAAVQVQGLIEEYDRQAEKLRQVRDDEANTIQDRIAANEELGRVLDEQEAKMLENAQARIDAAELELSKNRENIEAQIEYQEALNERAAIEAQIEGFRSEQLMNRMSLNRELADMNKEAAIEEVEVFKWTQETKEQAMQQGIAGLTALVGENSKFGKGIAIAQAIRDTYAGATKALAQGGIFGTVAAAGIIASGIANVRAITATSDPTPPSYASAPSGGGFTAPTIQAQAPDFNVVGASGMNQLAETIAGAQSKPQRAYVVANDVTTAQGMDRNIVEGASI
jgi:hypothetical protein